MRIALVDPSRAVQRAIENLVAQDGHEIIAFSDGMDALGCIEADPTVSVLITSVHLPDISGFDLCTEARKVADVQRPLVIIVMSSIEDVDATTKALNSGADDFMHKPPSAEELRARLRAAERLTSMQRELIKHATTDYLTGVMSRRAFFESAIIALRAAGPITPVSAILFDIDHFKSINDTGGHAVGDIILANVANTAQTMASGIVGRLGGEEFCILERCDLGDAVELAETLRTDIKRLKIAQYHSVRVTCSFGVSTWEEGDTIDSLIRRADLAMYEAKRSGRDRVVAMDDFALTDQHDKWRGLARLSTRQRS
jgi:two-component system, cell cycle response regulator